MFERYTEKARRIIFFARYEASQFGSHGIEPEHLLLALFREARAALDALGVPTNLEEELRSTAPASGEKISTSVDLPLSHSAKRVLAYGAEEAEALSSKYIAPEHLLLGILRESGTHAELLLRKHGVTIAPVREKLIQRGIDLTGAPEQTSAHSANKKIVSALRDTFAPIASRLVAETEPAVTFILKPGAAA